MIFLCYIVTQTRWTIFYSCIWIKHKVILLILYFTRILYNNSLFNSKDDSTLLGAISQKRQTNGRVAEYNSVLKAFSGTNKNDILETDFSTYSSLSDDVIDSLEEIRSEMNKDHKTADDMFNAIQEQMDTTAAKSTKLGAAFAGIGKVLVNSLASAAIAAAVSWLIGKAIEIADSWIITRKEAEKMAESFSNNFSEMQKSQGDTLKTITQLEPEFEKLSAGVNALGQNVSLTDEEFERYHEITNTIADKIPSIVSGYDEQGNAIIRLTDNVKSLSDAYRDEMQAEAAAQYAMEDDSGNTLVEGVFKNARNKTKDAGRKREIYDQLVKLNFDQLQDLYFDDRTDQDILNALNDAGFNSKTTEDEAKRVHAELVMIQRKYESDLKNISTQVSNAGMEFAQSLTDYWGDEFTDAQREMMNSFMSNMDIDFLLKTTSWGDQDNLDLFQQEDMERFVSSLMSQIQQLNPKDIEQINTRFNLITTFNNGEITVGEYEEKLQELNNWMNAIPDEGLKKMVEILFSITGDEESEIERYRQHLKDIMGGKYTDEFADNLKFEELKATMTIEPKVEYDEFGNELKYVEEKIMYDRQGVPYKVYIKPEYDSDEIREQIGNDLSPVEVEIEPKTKYSEQTASLDELEKSFSGLATTYDTTVNQKVKVDASDLEKVNSDMGGVTFNVKDEDVDKINSMSNAIEAYDQTLIKSAGDADAAQDAANKLATAYVDHSDVLDNLIDHLDEVTEEEKAYVKEQLEVNGIQNAEEVMTTRLTKRYKAYSAALVDVSKQMAQYRNDVENVIETGEDSNGVASKMKESVSKMLSTYNDEGVAITTPQIDEQFIVDNLAQIKAATEGDVAAFDELMFKVAQLNAMQVLIDANIDEETAAAQAANIMDMVMQANEKDIEIGAYIDDAPFLAALSEMMSSSQTMADSVGKAFESMGYEATWVPNRYTTKVATAIIHNGGTGNTIADEAMRRGLSDLKQEQIEVDVPSLQIRRKGTAAGASAVYGSAPKSSGSGGGNGSGGGGGSENKPKEESEETFDWIEVAIQRIEEEIARLDKVVGNSYDIWINRNTALLKEINKTKEEIKAQQIAYKEYLRNANLVKVNDGKDLNPDDYGENDKKVKENDQTLLDEARAAWATGEYQRKVREGLMTGDDIEKIQNHFLSNAIKSYQELYNKAVSAKDAIQDLNIKLGDLARTNFDQVKTQAEDAIAYFDSYADLINERISRTEERGYFVTKSYQAELTKFEKERLALLKNEYNELIKKRDEAVQNGYIKAYSSEWNSLNQEILDVGKSIEEATTNLVKFNNEMRQHDWDVFDYTQERIGKITEEFDFLIDLLDNQKLYDDYGAFNKRGWADTALHAGKYNTYMQQSLDYAKERAKIEKELAKDEGNKTLIERREELIKLQQESIQNAYAEKEAVKSLVEEGKYFALIKFV